MSRPSGLAHGAGTALIFGLARVGGRAGCRVGARLDVLRGAGAAYAWRRLHEESALAATDAGDRVYDRIWRDAAAELGATVTELGGGFLEIARDGARTRVTGNVTAIDDPVVIQLALNKVLVHSLLTTARVPVPEHVEVEFPDLRPARDFLTATGSPCVVKPASGTSGGDGVTSCVRSASDLIRACVRAARTGRPLLVERQVLGAEYRLLFLDGRLLDTVCRLPVRLQGDGRSSVAELLAEENRRRIRARGEEGLRLLTLDLDAMLALERAGVQLRSVPRAGAAVTLKGLASQAGPAESKTVHASALGDDLVAECRAAAAAVGLRFAGVDVIASDSRRSLRAGGGAVIEVNGTPGLHYHYHVADRRGASRVAVPLLSALLSPEVNQS
jgi:D-alanine-D-alanine ligase-like ATP-grasp enzyme